MGLNLAVTAALVLIGILIRTPGAASAMIALSAAYVAEVAYLRKSMKSV
jgi:hypothetical protein